MKRLTLLSVFLLVWLTGGGAFAAPAVTNLPENRILLFNDYTSSNTTVLLNQPWTSHEGPMPNLGSPVNRALLAGTNHFHRTGWRLLSVRGGSAGYLGFTIPQKVPWATPIYPAVASNLAANLRYESGALVESPVLTNGLGTVYFEAINNLAAYSGQINVEVATNMVDVGTGEVIPTILPPSTNNLELAWATNDVLVLSAATSNDFTRFVRTLNFRGPLKFRLRRTGDPNPAIVNPDSAFVVVDNIRLSPPPTDVSVYGLSAFNQAGHFKIQAYVSNADTNVPTDSRTVTAYYRWLNLAPPANAWTNTVMSRVDVGDGQGNGERYELVLPEQLLGGDLEYYAVCDFGGYMYRSPDYTQLGYAGYATENLSPFTASVQTQHLAGADLYTLTVNSGTGGGAYTNGAQVAIAASNLEGQGFFCWTGATQYVADAFSPATTVSMPNFDIAVTATYTNNYYTMTVVGGSGSGVYPYGQAVPIVASNLANKVFDRWAGAAQYVDNPLSASAVVTIPATNITLTATYIDLHSLTVNGGSGGGAYTNGQQVVIAAAAPPVGKMFYRWTGDTAYAASVTSATTVVTMPPADIALTATYIDIFTLTVNSGSGSGSSYTNGQLVAISANAPAAGKRFSRWTGDTAYVVNAAASNTFVSMPAADVEVTANYDDIYRLTVTNGFGSGVYTNGEQVTISANPPAAGMAFACWTGATQYLADARSPLTTLAMPPLNIGLTATYSNLYYTLTVTGGSGSGAYTNGQSVGISADVPFDKTFERWSGDTAYVASVTSVNTTVTMPALNITVAALLSSQTSLLDENRFLHFNDYIYSNTTVLLNQTWTLHEGPMPTLGSPPNRALLAGTNHFHRTGWKLINCRAGSSAYITGNNFIPPRTPSNTPTYPAVASNLTANLRYEMGAMIVSPAFTNGIGTIYFEAINSDSSYPAQFTVEIATNMQNVLTGSITNSDGSVIGVIPADTNYLEYVWEAVDVQDVSAASTNDFMRYSRTLNCRSPVVLRIRRTGELNPLVTNPDLTFLSIDNIRVPPPPSDVILAKTDAPFEPGYPSVQTNITVRCYVSNADMNVPTDSRTPKVVYRWRFLNQVVLPWRTNTMTYVEGTGDGEGNGELYQADLSQAPFSEVGDLEYYFLCEFGGYLYLPKDYTGLNYAYPSMNLSPKVYRGDSQGKEFSVRLRPYGSDYDKLYVVADTNRLSTSVFEMKLVGLNEWRGMVPIAGTGLTNLVWRFMGVNEYVPGAGEFSSATSYWAGVSGIADGRVPYGGQCAVTNASGWLSVLVDEGNYVLLTFSTDTLTYLATRGEYQNFNLWPAPTDTFTESNGQDPKNNFANTFNNWPVNQDRVFLQAFAGYPPTTNTFVRDPFLTINPEFVAGSAAYVSERTMVDNTVNAPTNVLKFRNVAMRLKGGDGVLGLGYLYNRVATLPDGLKEVTFRARQGQDVDNYRIAYYRDGFTNLNYAIRATARNSNPLSLSPHKPSVSLIGYYRDAENFYEYRVTQTNDPNDLVGAVKDKTVLHQLIKWQAGVPYLKANVLQTGISSPPLSSDIIKDETPLEMAFLNEGSVTRIRCRYANAEKINFPDSGGYDHGTIGFVSAECASSLSNVKTLGTTAAYPYGTGTEFKLLRSTSPSEFNSDVEKWYLPASHYVANSGISPPGIYSVTPSQQIAIYTQDTDYGSDVEPDGVGSTAWKLSKTVTVPGYSYYNVTVTNSSWRSQFVMLQVQGGAADVVVDEVAVSSWHGQLNFDGIGENPYTYSDWGASESWVVTNTDSYVNTVYLDHSRANPGVEQAIRSPYIETGLGLMEFDFRVRRGPAELKVQAAFGDEDDNWQDVETFTFATATSWQHVSCYLGTNSPGFFRVLNAREGIYSNAWLEIDNVSLWDEPTVTNNSWRAYNVKITSTDTNRVMIDETKACYLNSSQVLDTDPVQTHFEPFLRSPELPRGMGELSFSARAYTNGQAATLYLYASTNGWNAASDNWFEVTRFENITNGLYKLFTYEPVDGREFNAIQLGTKTGPLDRRVCLDEVTIAEPVFPNFDIVNVQLMSMTTEGEYYAHPQPVEGEEVHVQAQIDNIQMQPSNIVMYVSYYIGTNVWGVDNWPSGEVVTRRLTNNVPGQPTLYRTVPQGASGFPYAQTGGIEGLERDQVVQYHVWAEYDGGIHLLAKQRTFVNPDWYYPIDLNARYSKSGWSPYFFVYTVPLNSVWINEINATDYVEENGTRVYGIWDNVYIEIAVPAWLDLAGWKVDLVKTAAYTTQTITIPAGLPQQTAYTNGYAFFVIGGAPSTDPRIPALPKVDFVYPSLKTSIASIMPGGVRLRRPAGMYEQASAYDWDPDPSYGISFSGTNWAARDPQKRFVYVGREYDGGALSVTNHAGQTLADWASTNWPWTPGDPNVGQVVPNGDALVPGVSNVLITSTLNLLKATQNGKRVNLYSLKMKKGQSTNIVYRTDPWYRLFSVQKDLAEQLPSLGTETNFTLALPNLQADVGVAVDVRLRQDLTDMNLDADVLNWILGFVDSDLVPMYYNDRQLTITEQYWLDANPTQSNTFELAISRFEIDPGTNFHVTVKMALNGQKKSSFNGGAVLKLQTKSRLLDTGWTMISQYSLTADSFDASNTCRVFVSNPFEYVLAGVDPNTLFFRWLIELNDPRVSTHVLTNAP